MWDTPRKIVFQRREIELRNQIQLTTRTKVAIRHTMKNSNSKQQQLQQQP